MKGNIYRNGLVLEICVVKGQVKATEHVTSAMQGTNQLARSGDTVFLHTHTHTFPGKCSMHHSVVKTGRLRPVKRLIVACGNKMPTRCNRGHKPASGKPDT